MQKIDYVFVLTVFLFVGLLLFAMFWPKRVLPGSALLTLKIEESVDVLDGKIIPGENIYLNGSNNVSKVVSSETKHGNIIVKISGPADRKDEVYNFNGQRVLIGQKAELHGSFFARAKIEKFEYEK